jgi:hypothetical protein
MDDEKRCAFFILCALTFLLYIYEVPLTKYGLGWGKRSNRRPKRAQDTKWMTKTKKGAFFYSCFFDTIIFTLYLLTKYGLGWGKRSQNGPRSQDIKWMTKTFKKGARFLYSSCTILLTYHHHLLATTIQRTSNTKKSQKFIYFFSDLFLYNIDMFLDFHYIRRPPPPKFDLYTARFLDYWIIWHRL